MKLKTVNMMIGVVEIAPTAEAIAYRKRIEDPQDLEDGLLAVAHDQMVAELQREMERRMVQDLFQCLGVPSAEPPVGLLSTFPR